MKKRLVTITMFALFGATMIPGEAAVVTYTDRALFNAAAPGLPVETFDNNKVAVSTQFTPPLDSDGDTGNVVFDPGDILTGIVITEIDGGGDSLQLWVSGGFAPFTTTSDIIGNSTLADGLRIDFTDANAVGFDAYLYGATTHPTVTFFNDTEELWSTGSSAATSQFFGVVNTGGSITHVTIEPNLGDMFGGNIIAIDNLAFGIPIPEPGVLTLMTIGLAGCGCLGRRRRSA